MKDKIILKDGKEIEIKSSSSLSDIKTVSDTKNNMISKWDLLTDENLKFVQIRNADGLTIGSYENLVLDSEKSIVQKDGTILTSFSLREKTEIELLREEVNALKEGQEVQDEAIQTHNEAIGDLGQAVSDMTEGGGQ